ncbi:uncharacterized protein JCM6883_003222 [Sporobolomyces salmoneus]|uniref:uncharacterized protein n=1 Tax=Sporobolomyces salmoneus TaxID=183962 RepID=UPI0031770ACB
MQQPTPTTTRAIGLHSLPPEILIRIIRFFLDPQSILRLPTTCTILNEVCRSELVWKEVVLRLVEKHGVRSLVSANPFPSSNLSTTISPDSPSSWWQQAKFLLPNARHLGYFASSIPFSSRIIRVSILTLTHPSSPHSAPRYSIQASQLIPSNSYSITSPPPPHLLPHGATLEITLDAYQISRIENPTHPDAGISIDCLDPTYDFERARMFEITEKDGAVLAPSRLGRTGGRVAGGRGGEQTRAEEQDSTQTPAHRLRLSLEPITQVVHSDRHPSSRGDDSHTGTQIGGEGGVGGAQELSREALLALFSGRLPRRPWPTLQLVGLQQGDGDGEDETEESISGDPSWTTPGRNRSKRLRTTGRGAFRGIEEWVSERGVEEPLARIIGSKAGQNHHVDEKFATSSSSSYSNGLQQDRAEEEEEAVITGFKLRAKRTTSRANPSDPSSSTGTPSLPTPPLVVPEETMRRRGVGRNGGMAVLWNGMEEDPEATMRPVTILRAGDQEQGGVVLRLEEETTANRILRRTESPRRHNFDTNEQAPNRAEEASVADAVDTAGEVFFPIKAPAKRFVDQDEGDLTCVEEGGDITALSLEGTWVGTYGSHGLEFVHLSCSYTSFPSTDTRPPTPLSTDSSPSPPPPTSTTRILTATKLTGDTNVPSGETTWIAFLDSTSSSSTAASPPLNLSNPIPTISKEKWIEMNRFDPNPSSSSMITGRETRRRRYGSEDWEEGTTKGVGQIALSGFLQPGWTRAKVRFVREKTRVRVNRRTGERRIVAHDEGTEEEEGEWEEKVFESVEEIQLRWTELNKIAVFKRVRI